MKEPESNEKTSVDQNVEDVITQIRKRVEKGIAKYGVTTDREDLSLVDWIVHAKEEAMDFIVYLNRIEKEARKIESVIKDAKGNVLVTTYELRECDGCECARINHEISTNKWGEHGK